MGRHKKTQEQADLDGSAAKNPGRYAGEVPKNDAELGEPPRYFSAALKKVWAELAGNCLPGIVTVSDCYFIEVASLLIYDLRETEKNNRRAKTALKGWQAELAKLKGEWSQAETNTDKETIADFIKDHRRDKPTIFSFPTSRLQALKGYLSSLGMSPTDRQRLRIPGEGDGDEDDEFKDM